MLFCTCMYVIIYINYINKSQQQKIANPLIIVWCNNIYGNNWRLKCNNMERHWLTYQKYGFRLIFSLSKFLSLNKKRSWLKLVKTFMDKYESLWSHVNFQNQNLTVFYPVTLWYKSTHRLSLQWSLITTNLYWTLPPE